MHDELLKILKLKNDEIELYVDNRLNEFGDGNNVTQGKEKIVSAENIYWNWISLNTTYLPSGSRSKGFKVDKCFLVDFIVSMKKFFEGINLDRVKSLPDDVIFNMLIVLIGYYFGTGELDQQYREYIYGYGDLKSFGKTLNISELKGLNVARCIEKSAALNLILNILRYNSSLVSSSANGIGHAYCFLIHNHKNIIIDPSLVAINDRGEPVTYIFEFDPNSRSCVFDPSEYGCSNSLKVTYDFPFEKLYDDNKHK